jgi:hypothetical protein
VLKNPFATWHWDWQASPKVLRSHFLIGKWLSLVEHSVRDAGVGGSNPLFPTNKIKRLWISP